MTSYLSQSYILKTSSARPTRCVPSTAIVRTLCVVTAISRPRARARFLDLLCRRRRRSALPRHFRLRANNFLLSVTFSIIPFPYPRTCVVFWSRDVGSAVPPHPAPPIFRLRGESGAYSQATYINTYMGVGKERRTSFDWSVVMQRQHRYWNYLEDFWPCAGGLSAVNAIGYAIA